MSGRTVLKRKNFTIEEKLDAVDRVRKGVRQTDVAKDLNVNESTLRGWLQSESKLREFISDIDTGKGLKRKRARQSANPELDRCMKQWIDQTNDAGIPISGPIAQAQALKFNMELDGSESFKASCGYLNRFRDRHEIKHIKLYGESRSADEQGAIDFIPELKDFLEQGNYQHEQIYNCDETGLWIKGTPKTTLCFKPNANSMSGFKQIKDRLTILLCVNKTGNHKLMPLVLGKFQNPRCFHHINRANLPVLYDHSRNAWMTREIFSRWFHGSFVPAVRKHLRSIKMEQKALLLMDNCPGHPAVDELVSKDGKIRVKLLPKNTTSKIQPLDQGIIENCKRNYRHEMIKEALLYRSVKETTTVTDYLKQLNIKGVIDLIHIAWTAIPSKSIANCWDKALGAAFTNDRISNDDDEPAGDSESDSESFYGFDDQETEPNRDDQVNSLLELCKECGIDTTAEAVQEWINVDTDWPTHEILNDDEIIERARKGQVNESPDCDETEHDEDDNYGTGIATEDRYTSHSTALESITNLISWAEENKMSADTYVYLLRLRGNIRQAQLSHMKQQKLTSYFSVPK